MHRTLTLPALIEISTGVERSLNRRALRVGGRLTGRAITRERYLARCDAIAAAIGREPAAVLFTQELVVLFGAHPQRASQLLRWSWDWERAHPV
jgi:hypothetical protein